MKGKVSVRLELDRKEVEKIIEDIRRLAERLSETFPFSYPGLAALRELLLELDPS